MPHESEEAQEKRSERVTIVCTPTEKRAVRGVSAIRGTDESTLLRECNMDEIMDLWWEIQEAANGRAAAGDGEAPGASPSRGRPVTSESNC